VTAVGIMGTAKPFASLSSGLLARKGAAKPAMRPQLYNPAASLDDLGWNDMDGHDVAEAVELPPVLVEREELAVAVAAPVIAAPAPVAPVVASPAPIEAAVAEPVARPLSTIAAARIGRESAKQTAKGKAAFTLRLDAARHLRLRLASAVGNRAAHALVADALDQFLATMPEVEALAAQLPMKKA